MFDDVFRKEAPFYNNQLCVIPFTIVQGFFVVPLSNDCFWTSSPLDVINVPCVLEFLEMKFSTFKLNSPTLIESVFWDNNHIPTLSLHRNN
uniref:Putative ovule protein n=1 Tax=Solanum chacoense TaxID=4108 RepID=A0A0V0GTL7_SOLCH